MNKTGAFIGYLMFFLLVMLFPSNNVLAKSIQDIDSELNRIEQEQKKINKQRNDLKQDQSNVQSKMNKNMQKQTEIEQEIQQIDEKLVSAKIKINEKETEIFQTNERIESLNEQLDELTTEIELITDRIEKREKLLKSRLRSIQETGGETKIVEVLLGSESFVDFISRSSALHTIMGQDQTLIEENTSDKKELEKKQTTVKRAKKEVEEKMVALEEQKQELVVLKDTLDKQVAKKGKLLAQLDEEYQQLDEYRVTIAEEQKAADAQVSSLEKAKKLAKQEKARLQTLSQGGGNGTFIWPATGRQSSSYGIRVHPIFKTRTVHHGIDIATAVGTQLKAAGSGVVSVAKYMGGYGNVIMITHMVNGQQLTTVYAHLSKISVSPGQVVQQGQVIGATGNTGNSTGPHLHFEVHKGSWNASRSNSTNPIPYLP